MEEFINGLHVVVCVQSLSPSINSIRSFWLKDQIKLFLNSKYIENYDGWFKFKS